ncbi:hypothetical protein [Bradyrhizobium sp. Leo170]|uniref:hypothetical protein n=1 Tax=Bradyrhizobium sp. Leo170 TaxID=1571199 RepID=UPI00102ECF0B|nr:hypothetical protein [Bradyrhizobium sp. Leo170]TAI61325.1 hypothetical protein CWO89_35740 [Bradyrhizobium sp. Leo170]
MRHTEANAPQADTSTAWKALMHGLRLAAVGLVMAAGPVRAGDDGDDEDDKTFEEKVIEGVMKGLGGTNMENRGIDYRERSPLVVPPNLNLPAPAASAEAKVPNWPKDPDEARRKAAIAARKNTNKDPREASRILSPSELAQKSDKKSSGGESVDQPGGNPGANAILSPSQLGYEGGFSGLFGGSKTETATFKSEPTRESLTQPPPGYQTPSPNFAYGTGPKESLNKEYNPSQGKYGD